MRKRQSRALQKEQGVASVDAACMMLDTLASQWRTSASRCMCIECKTRRLVRTSRDVRPHPMLKDQKIASQLIRHLSWMHPLTTWFELLPMRLVRYPSTDLTCLALIEALDYRRGGMLESNRLHAAFLCYGKAVKHLRDGIQSPHVVVPEHLDDCVITTALLSVFEAFVAPRSINRQHAVTQHWTGLSTALQVRQQVSPQMSDIFQAIAYEFNDVTTGIYAASDTPSPFETEQWHSLLGNLHPLPAYQMRLRRISNEASVRSPRLTSYVRQIRGTAPPSCVQDELWLKMVFPLAEDLLSLSDDEGEAIVMKNAILNVTRDPSWRFAVPKSLCYASPEDCTTVTRYWMVRIIIMNLYLQIAACHSHITMPEEIVKLEAERTRHSERLMMSWEYSELLGPFQLNWVAKGCAAAFKEIRYQAIVDQTGHGRRVMEWLLPRRSQSCNEWQAGVTSEEDLEVLADFLAGGPLNSSAVDATASASRASTENSSTVTTV